VLLLLPERTEAQGEVNIYSHRQPSLIKPLLDAFTEKTGVKANVIFAEKGLSERIAAEGRNSPADLLLAVDIGNLVQAVPVAQAIESSALEASIPEAYRDPDGRWWGLTRRARVVYASKDRVEQDEITYEDLADPQWKGKICVRPGQHVYNVALVAAMIAHHGEAETEKWLQGVKANLTRKPAGNDRLQVKSVYAGECDLAIGNTYYMGAMVENDEEPEQKKWAQSVKMLFPNSADRGTHVNISGAVVAQHAPNKENAIKLLEFLTSDEGQKFYAEINHEYPVKDGVEPSALVASWGELTADSVSLSEIANHRKAASQLIDKVGFDDGPSS
jgi:iron(III) transport system substrate-binding protein